MKILGIDYGDKRIGLAIAENNWIFPKKNLSYHNLKKAILFIQNLIKKEEITKVVVGLPYPLGTSTNERLQKTKNFAEALRKVISCPLEFTSEIFTTKLAKKTAYCKGQHHYIDARAACFILEQYLKEKKE